MMKKTAYIILFFISVSAIAQNQDATSAFKKRVLENSEVDFLISYYKQDGVHSPVSGGIGSENLTDIASNVVVAIPLNDDDVLTFDVGISAYTSASSSNINPFNATGASTGGGGDDDENDDKRANENRVSAANGPYGTPWQASSGASGSDELASVVINYSHSSDNRNSIWNADVSFSNEYDYTSIGFGGGFTQLFNQKNTEIGIKINVYLDQWRPIYPTELHEYSIYGSNFQNQGYFSGISILDQNGNLSNGYLPSAFTVYTNYNRNSYSASLSLSQILSKKIQMSVFMDILMQDGLLATPYQRIYFADKPNYYIGQAQYIPVYETSQNKGVYRLSDDIERLPNSRFKIPIGARINFYINEYIVAKTYYRYYQDNWGIEAQTASIELPVKINQKFTVYPMFRYYSQTASDYFAPFEKHISTEKYYTSDYDLSSFNANQYGFGVTYLDILTSSNIWKLGLKNVDFRYNHYVRSDGLNANILSLGCKFILQ